MQIEEGLVVLVLQRQASVLDAPGEMLGRGLRVGVVSGHGVPVEIIFLYLEEGWFWKIILES